MGKPKVPEGYPVELIFVRGGLYTTEVTNLLQNISTN